MTSTSVAGNADNGADRTVTCDMTFAVSLPSEIVLQVVAADTAGPVRQQSLDIRLEGVAAPPVELRDRQGARMHVLRCDPGRLTVAYRARLAAAVPTTPAAPPEKDALLERQVYLRPSRYCPSDHLVGFSVAQFGTGPDVVGRVAAITRWIRQRIGYVPGSSTVHDSAEHTLLTGMGTCRDFAHLGIALCRATGVPARFVAVYAPGLSPMDFHAVFEAFENGRWYVYDSTGLAPRQSLVRVVTGRDAADAAFAATISGTADLERFDVSATVDGSLPSDDVGRVVELA